MMSPSFRGKGGKGSNSEEKNMPNSKMESGGWRWSEKKILLWVTLIVLRRPF